jgi:hypothetical protein
MALLNLPIDAITPAHLDRLITTASAESLYIDYKASTYGGSPADHREFLADISSFANTVGGDLVIGMTETDGIPTGFSPFPDYPDAELRRLDDMARSGLQPRVNLRTNAVASPIGGYVIVVRIPRSYNKPHRVIHTQSNRFWARSSASPKKYEPDVQELRQIFNEAPVLAERIRAFRTTRLTDIAHQRGSIAMRSSCLLLLHLVPFSGFDLGIGLSVAELENQWHLFPPLGRQHGTHRLVNFDGLVILSTGDDPRGLQPS